MNGGIYEGPSGQKLHGDGRSVGKPPVAGSATCLVCPDCGSSNLRSYRREWGKPDHWSFSWEEGIECVACGRKRIPALGIPNDRSKPQPE